MASSLGKCPPVLGDHAMYYTQKLDGVSSEDCLYNSTAVWFWVGGVTEASFCKGVKYDPITL